MNGDSIPHEKNNHAPQCCSMWRNIIPESLGAACFCDAGPWQASLMTLPCKAGIAFVSATLRQLHQQLFEVAGSVIVPHTENA